MRRVKSKCTGKSFHANLLNQYQIRIRKDACKQEIGSSDWTRTSDIRINSPPFYRLNYRGIVGTGRIIAGRLRLVKRENARCVRLLQDCPTCCFFSLLSLIPRAAPSNCPLCGAFACRWCNGCPARWRAPPGERPFTALYPASTAVYRLWPGSCCDCMTGFRHSQFSGSLEAL